MGRRKHLALFVAIATAAGACDASHAATDPVCLADGGGMPVAIPADTQVSVGDQFNLIQGYSRPCQSAAQTATTWGTSDMALIRLNAQTGHVVALKVGDAFVQSSLGGDAHIRIR